MSLNTQSVMKIAGFPVIDVTDKTIEETATSILKTFFEEVAAWCVILM